MMPQLDSSVYFSQLFWLFVCLAVLVLLFKKHFVPRMNLIISKRDEMISGKKTSVAELEKKICLMQEEIKKLNTDALKKSSEIIISATRKAEEILNDQMNIIKKENDELIYGTRKRLENEIKNLDTAFKVQIELATQKIFSSIFEKELNQS